MRILEFFRGLTRAERALIAAVAMLAAIAVIGPAVAQSAHHHHFADQRALWGIPFAMDVISNLPFVLAAGWGAWALRRAPASARNPAALATYRAAALLIAGLGITAFASAWYHLRPDDAGLVVDRLGMSVAFAGMLALAVAERVSGRAAYAMAAVALTAAVVAVGVWAASGNVLPWAVVQFGGMAIVLAVAVRPGRAGALQISFGAVLACYALAKLLEAGDLAIFHAVGGLVSGHSLKHAVAALAALPVLWALRPMPAKAGGRHRREPASTPDQTLQQAEPSAGHNRAHRSARRREILVPASSERTFP